MQKSQRIGIRFVSQRSSRSVWVATALIVFLVASVTAWMQPPPPRLEHHTGLDWLLNPIERNAKDRFPSVQRSLSKVAITNDGKRVIAVGVNGTILTSLDGGQRWAAQTSVTNNNLLDIALSPNGRRAVAVGDYGTVLTSRDGGQHWTAQISGANNTLAGISLTGIALSADGQYAVASGSIGTILISRDGGQHWTAQTSGTYSHLTSTALSADGKRAIVVGDDGAILTSNDGGQLWTAQTSGTKKRLTSIALSANGGHAVVVGDQGTILTSNDGGQHWAAQTGGSYNNLTGIALSADGQYAVAAGDIGTILTSGDGGRHWTALICNSTEDIRICNTTEDLRGIGLSADGERAVAVGVKGAILTSRDGGQYWKTQTGGIEAVHNGIALSADGQRAIAVGDYGTILTSHDGGQHWAAEISGTDGLLYDSALSADGQHAVVAVSNGMILTSRDGGQQWTTQTSRADNLLNDIALSSDGERAVAVGHNGTILTIGDGERHWTARASGTNEDLTDIELSADGQHATAWGVDNGTIVTSHDGGQHWTARAGGPKKLFNLVLSANGQNAIAIGDNATIVISGDGGQNWTETETENSSGISSFALSADGQRAIAVGTDGKILTSGDSGKRWMTQTSGANYHLSGIGVSADGQHAIAMGENRTILISHDGGQRWQPGVLIKKYARYPAPWYYLSLALSGLLLYRAFSGKPDAMQTGAAAIAASDAPASSIDQDRLGFAPLARGISRFLRNSETRPPLTLAITGEWGSGKSSLMGQVCDDLKTNGWRPVWFNAWHHQNEEQLLAALLVAVRDSGVPRILSTAGVGFRLRLLLIRARQRMFVTLLVIALASLVIALIAQHPDAGEWQAVMSFYDALKGKDGMPDLSVLQSILPALGTTGVLFAIVRAMRTFGVDPAVLLSSTMAKFRLKDASAQTSFRMRFAQQFGEVTEALAHPMVIVIDDLDRCEPETVLDVMQAVNFLTSSGRCFVIFGMATQRVQAALALSFKEIAAELVQFDQVGGDERKRRQDYARDYLEKLINIEILVPKRADIPPSRLLEQHEETPLAPLVGIFAEARRWWPMLPIALAIALGIWLASLMSLPESPTPAETPPSVDQTAPQKAPPPNKTNPLAITAKPTAQPNTSPIFVPGDDEGVSLLWFLSALSALALLGAVLFLRRLRQQALIVQDTRAFKDAVKIWTPIATFTRNSPRSIKRFGNRIRYLAMLQQGQQLDDKRAWVMTSELAQRWLKRLAAKIIKPASPPVETPESADEEKGGLALSEHLIVALGAMHAHFGDDWRRMASAEAIAVHIDLLSGDNINLVTLTNKAIDQYRKIAGASWPPSRAQLDAFERSLKGVRLPGDGRTINSSPSDEKSAPSASSEANMDRPREASSSQDHDDSAPIKK
jgi:photosystem II stability/assembly factor-like uncharacterized protein